MGDLPATSWAYIGSYAEIIEEARKARDVGAALASVTHALCAIGLDLQQIAAALTEGDTDA